MKSKYLILVIGFIVALIATVGYIMFKDEELYTVTLDINPSLELKIDKNNKIKHVKALNDDAKDIISSDLKGISLFDALEKITEKVIEEGYIKDDFVVILISSTGDINNEDVKHKLEASFNEKNIGTDVIVIDNITEEDKKMAYEYNISPAKASYINSIKEKNDKVDFETLTEKSVAELRETKETGKYCDEGYYLEGDFCIKEVGVIEASEGEVCPDGYLDYEGMCYREVKSIETDEYFCYGSEDELKGDKCYFKEYRDAIADFKCEVGTLVKRDFARNREVRDNGNQNDYLCEDTSNASHPTERCYLQEHAIINGMCAMGPKPLLPTATGCEGHDINFNGGCYDPYPDEPYICPNGERFDTNDVLCSDTFTYTMASGEYKCEEGYTLSEGGCFKDKVADATHVRVCPEGYTNVYHDRCIDLNDQKSFIDGFICDREDARLLNGKCVIIKMVEAKQ